MAETGAPPQIASQTRGLESVPAGGGAGPVATGEPLPADLLPELDYACRAGRVDFNQLVTAAFLRQPTFTKDAEQRQAYEYYFPRLSETFESQHDGIARSYYATNVVAAAVLTNDKELFLKLPDSLVKDVDAVGLLSRLTLLHIRARQYLDREDYRACLDPVFQVIVYCLSVFDSNATALITTDEEQEQTARRSALMTLLASESGRSERYLWDLVSRKALLQYFYGMLIGLALILVATPMLRFAPELFKSGSSGNRNDVLQWALAGGAVGAFISVMQRITNGRFNLSRSTITLQKRKHVSVLMVLGALRPLVGAVFGVALFTFQNAGLVPFQPAADVDQTVYFAALGFLIGFSERFARDMVLAAEPASADTDSRVVHEQQVYPTPGPEVHVDRTAPEAKAT